MSAWLGGGGGSGKGPPSGSTEAAVALSEVADTLVPGVSVDQPLMEAGLTSVMAVSAADPSQSAAPMSARIAAALKAAAGAAATWRDLRAPGLEEAALAVFAEAERLAAQVA